MRRGGVLALLTAAVALLAGLWGLLRTDAPEAAPAEASAAPGYEMLYERPLHTLRGIRVTLKDGESYRVSPSMVFDEAGRLLGVATPLRQPLTVDGREDFALDAGAYQMLLLTAQGIPATARYAGLDLDACGLTQPAAEIAVEYADGTELLLRVGDKTASGASCYVTLDGGSEVCLVPYDFYDVMTRPLRDQHALPGSLALTAEDAVQIAVDGGAAGRVIVSRQAGDSRVLKWAVTTPVTHDASEAAVERFVQGLCAVRAEGYAGTAADLAGLAAYGLDAPARYVAAFSDGTIRDLHVGGDAGDGRVYVRLDKTGDVYMVSRGQLEFTSGAGLDTLMDRFVDLVPLGTVDSVTVRTSRASWRMTQSWPSADAATADGWAIGGQAVDQPAFSSVYALLVGLQFDKAATALPDGEPLVTITYALRGGERREVAVYPCDEYYHAVTTAGGAAVLVRRERIEAILKELEAYPSEAE